MKQIILLISLFLLPASNGQVFSATDVVRVVLNSQEVGAIIPADYSGLSYETRMMLPDANGQYYFSKKNQKLVRMFKRLGVKSLRLGGNSVDVNSTPYPTAKDIDALFGFAREAGVKVIYSVRLQDGSVEDAARQAGYIWKHYADLLDYFAVGNEPGYYKDYEYELRPRWERLMKTMRKVAPKARFCAPDDNPNPVLCQKLVRDYWNEPLQLLSMHSYPAGCAYKNPGDAVKVPFDYRERCDYLLSDRLPQEYGKIYNQMRSLYEKYPFRLSETSNYWYGGLDGASNAYATALWALDYMYWWAARGNQGVNFHTGDKVGGTDIAAHYAAFVTEGDTFDIRPLSYAIEMFDVGGHGVLFPVTLSDSRQLSVYATKQNHGQVYITIVNKQHGAQAEDRLLCLQFADNATPVLSASVKTMHCGDGDILARKGITISKWQQAEVQGNIVSLRVPKASAMVIRITTDVYHHTSERNEQAQYGSIKSNWQSLRKYQVPEWYRNAKFGIWAHWGPQSQPEYGDWYAMYMYKKGSRENKYHVQHYGGPEKVGFKDLIHLWTARNWQPERLIKLYKRAGARYFVAMANHHDNFDLWNSRYHDWNSTTEGPRRDVVGEWANKIMGSVLVIIFYRSQFLNYTKGNTS